jgi:vacuolar-type H+-ATPase subunit I/STV1
MSEIRQLTANQQRTRLMILLESERVKLTALAAAVQAARDRNDEDAAIVYDGLVANQQKKVERLDDKIEQLTNQLQAPALRHQLQTAEAELETAQEHIQQLQQIVKTLKQRTSQQQAELKLLRQQNHDLQDLNESYVNQIALLSIHERQNAEDHAHAVMTVSRKLAKEGLNIPARASAKHLDSDAFEPIDEEDWAINPRVDQTLFSVPLSAAQHHYTLSLIISSVAPEAGTSPIEIKLTELNRVTKRHSTRLIQGFSMSDAIAATAGFIQLYHQLAAEQAA